MFNYSGCGDFILDRLLTEANEKLHSNKLNIILQKEKIKRTENLLSDFRKSFQEQKNDLNIFINEEKRLEGEISKCNEHKYPKELYNNTLKTFSNKEGRLENNYLKRKHTEVISDCFTVTDETSSKTSSSETMGKEINSKNKDQGLFDNEIIYSKSSEVAEISESFKVEMPLELIELKKVKGVSITSICTRYYNSILLGGSNGFLMKFCNKEEHSYDTNVNDDIIHIEVMKESQRFMLVAFTKKEVIVFQTITDKKPLKVIKLLGMTNIYNDGTVLYIMLNNGNIKIINKIHWIVRDYRNNDYSKECVLFPCTILSKYILVNLKDKFLYKTQKKDFSGLQYIKGVEYVQNVTEAKDVGFLCSSSDVVWFLNKNGELIDKLHIQNELKFIQCNFLYMITTDNKNIIQVYRLVSECKFGEKIFEKQMEGLITSLHVKLNFVYVGVNDVVYILNLKC